LLSDFIHKLLSRKEGINLEFKEAQNGLPESFLEKQIYPALRFSDFNTSLFSKARNLIRSKTPAHLWLAMSDEEMLIKAGFYRRDLLTGTEGYTLGAALMFGTDEVIQSIIPYPKCVGKDYRRSFLALSEESGYCTIFHAVRPL
jgi:hypothetical protein